MPHRLPPSLALAATHTNASPAPHTSRSTKLFIIICLLKPAPTCFFLTLPASRKRSNKRTTVDSNCKKSTVVSVPGSVGLQGIGGPASIEGKRAVRCGAVCGVLENVRQSGWAGLSEWWASQPELRVELLDLQGC